MSFVITLLILALGRSAVADESNTTLERVRSLNQSLRDRWSETSTRLANIPMLCQGRLTTESGVPISTSDRTAQDTLYFTPYMGNRIALYTGTTWNFYEFSELSYSFTLNPVAANTNYDVFIYASAGTPTIELTAWSSATARATALTRQNGVWVRNGATTRRYIGTFRSSSTTTTEDSLSQRFVWNQCHRVPRPLMRVESTNTWAYVTAAFQAVNADTNNRVSYVLGLVEDPIRIRVLAFNDADATIRNNVSSSIGQDGTTTITDILRGGAARSVIIQQNWAEMYYRDTAATGIGFHYFQWIEYGNTATNWYGDNGDASQRLQAGVYGEVMG